MSAAIVTRSKRERHPDLVELMTNSDSYTRLPNLLDWAAGADFVDDEMWLQCLGEEWTGLDNVGLYLDDLDDSAFGSRDGVIPEMMTSAEIDAYNELADTFTIYRGCYLNNKWGLSWTLSKDVAESFPVRNRYQQPGQPLLVTAQALKKKVIAVKFGRGESEIIIRRPRHVSTRHIRAAEVHFILERVKREFHAATRTIDQSTKSKRPHRGVGMGV